MHSNRSRFLLYGVFALWGLLAAIFGFYDLSISKALYHPKLSLPIWIEKYGEIPGILTILFAFTLLNAGLEIKNNVLRWIVHILLFALSSLLFLYGFGLFLYHQFGQETMTQPLVGDTLWVSAIVVMSCTAIFVRYQARNFALRHKAFALITIWMGLTCFTAVQTLKSVWGRIRFRDLGGNWEHFSPWYLWSTVQGVPAGYSFPSGHTFFAWMLLPLFLFFLPKSLPVRMIALSSLIAWAFLVGTSRIVIGAHYASDVLFATGFCLVAFLLLYRRLVMEMKQA